MIPYKKIISIIITAVIASTLLSAAFASTPGLGNFNYTGNYTAGQFQDVGENDWFAKYVEDAYNYSFFRGKSPNTFDPGGLLTVGEAVVIAARMRSIYHTGSSNFAESSPFYAVYAEYALTHGIIESHGDYDAPATRANFAKLVFNALPPAALPIINVIPDYGITDVMPDSDFGPAAYALYRAGILAGSDSFGTFFPDSNITRAEASAVTVRIADTTARLKTAIPSYIPAEIIFQRSADAVIMLETFDCEGNSIRTGSGFFISKTGLALTVLHVFDGASSAEITLYSGEVYPLLGIHAFSWEHNLVIFSIDSEKEDWSYLNLADSDIIDVGSTVYALGSPQGMINAMSEGIISFSSRELGWDTLIQFTAPISFGSGGSPLLNTLGQVIGLASQSFVAGQNLNLAVPVNLHRELEFRNMITLEEFFHGIEDEEENDDDDDDSDE